MFRVYIGFVKVVQEYERAVIFRLGRLYYGGAKGPGETMTLTTFVDAESDIARIVATPVGKQIKLSNNSIEKYD